MGDRYFAFEFTAFQFSSLFLCAILAAASHDICEQEQFCSPDGPAVKFPFQLQGKQPEHCGYPGFNLYCDINPDTVLELPSSLKLFVEHINYTSYLIQVYEPEGCTAKQIRNLDISDISPFHFTSWDRFTLFNCSLTSNQSGNWSTYEGLDIDCLDTPGYKVHATWYQRKIDSLPHLELCTKLYSTWASMEMFGRDNRIHINWFLRRCEECERKGGICRMKNGTKDEIDCSYNRNSDTKMTIIGNACEIGIIILLLVIIAASASYSLKKMSKENQIRIKKFLEGYRATKPTRYTYQVVKRLTNDFKEQLGEGAYGTVFKGKISHEILVAVKLLHDSTRNGEEFINEVATMGRIHHINVVRLLGFCADGFIRALIYEFLPKGSLDKLIFSTNKQQNAFGWHNKMHDIALGIARGIEYLHQGCEQRILHFDIKPHNILIDDNFYPKISDFGLAKLCEKEKSAVSMTAARGTMGYMAPEVYSRHFGNVSSKSDIYSFGMLLLEMVGRRKNIDKRVQNGSQVNFPESVYRDLVNGEHLGIQVEGGGEDEIARKLALVGLWCIRWNPVDRPCITFVARMLEGNGENLNLPPNPFTSTNQTMHRRPLDSALEIISESE